MFEKHRNKANGFQPVRRPVEPPKTSEPRVNIARGTSLGRSEPAIDRNASVSSAGEDNAIVIGKGTSIAGDVLHCSRLEIFGELEGQASTDTLVVHNGGKVKGHIECQEASILGLVEGEIIASDCVDIRSTACIHGDVQYGSLSVETGAQLLGSVNLGSGSTSAIERRETAGFQSGNGIANGQVSRLFARRQNGPG
ncbi:MAG: bactofilin family protein [Hyphomicrobiaceae bacterium]